MDLLPPAEDHQLLDNKHRNTFPFIGQLFSTDDPKCFQFLNAYSKHHKSLNSDTVRWTLNNDFCFGIKVFQKEVETLEASLNSRQAALSASVIAQDYM